MRNIIAIVVMIAVAIGGLIRIKWGDTPKPIDLQRATDLVGCFSPRSEIPANTAVTIAPIPMLAGQSPPPPKTLEFRALTAVEVTDATPLGGATGKKTYIVTKNSGDLDFILPSGAVEIRRSGSHLHLAATRPIRFGVADGTSYEIIADANAEKPHATKPNQLTLSAGTRGELQLGAGQFLTALQPLAVAPWMIGTPVALTLVRAAGQKGLADLSIEARQAGLQFNAAGLSLTSCVRSNGLWLPVGVSEIKPRELGAATLVLSMPASVLPASLFNPNWSSTIELAVASTDGQYLAYGGDVVIDRVFGALVALIAVVVLFAWLFHIRHQDLTEARAAQLLTRTGATTATATAQARAEGTWSRWFSGLFTGADNAPSLSLFQIFFWTVITVWGLAYVFMVTGSLLNLTTEMMALLGIAGTGSVLARFIGQRESADSSSATQQPFEFWQILSTQGRFDLMKLQLFVFTLMIGIYVVWRVLDTAAFPVLDPNTLLLLGVSQGVYIGGKLAGATALGRAQALKLEIDVQNAKIDQLQKSSSALTSEETTLKGKTPPLSADEQKRLAEIPGLIAAKTAERTELTTKVGELQKKYDEARKEAGVG